MISAAPGTSRRTRRIAAINPVMVSWVATASSSTTESSARRVFPCNTPVSATTPVSRRRSDSADPTSPTGGANRSTSWDGTLHDPTANRTRPSSGYRSAPPPRPPDPTNPPRPATPAPTRQPHPADSADPSNSQTDQRTTPAGKPHRDDQPETRTHCQPEPDAQPEHEHPSDQDHDHQHLAPSDHPSRATTPQARRTGCSAVS